MNTLRTLVVAAVLAVVAYGVYASLHHEPPADPPGVTPRDWSVAPAVELPGAPTSGVPPLPGSNVAVAGGEAPPFKPSAPPAKTVATAPPGEAPPFNPPPMNPPPSAQAPPSITLPGEAPDAATTDGSPTAGTSDDTAQVAPADDPSQRDATESEPGAPAVHVEPNASGASPYPSPADAGASRYSAGAVMPASSDHTATPKRSYEFDATLREARAELEGNNLAAAHLALSQWYRSSQLSEDQNAELLELLDGLAGTVVYSRQSILEPAYEVQPGDTLQRIAEQYDVPWQLLAKINGISDPQRLRSGQTLKVVRGPFSASVELDDYVLTLWVDGRYAGRFPIGIGQDNSTPTGEFVVRGKVENPTYYGPDQVIDADDPANPLGDYWIDLGNQIGLHGTNEPDSIGRSESRGCIRLSPQDVEDVFDILSIGSTVVIRH